MLWLYVLVALVALVAGQHDPFNLPQAPRYAPKPIVPPEFKKFFELDGHAAQLMDTLMGPRPGGLFPEKTYEIGSDYQPQPSNNHPMHVPNELEKTLESFFTAPENPGQAFPPGFNPNGGGFSLQQNSKDVIGNSGIRRSPEVCLFQA